MKRYTLRLELDTLFDYLSKHYNIQLTNEDLTSLEKIAYMKEDERGLYTEVPPDYYDDSEYYKQ